MNLVAPLRRCFRASLWWGVLVVPGSLMNAQCQEGRHFAVCTCLHTRLKMDLPFHNQFATQDKCPLPVPKRWHVLGVQVCGVDKVHEQIGWAVSLVIGETVILLYPLLSLAGVSTRMERDVSKMTVSPTARCPRTV